MARTTPDPAQLGVLIPEDPRRQYRPILSRAFVFDQLTSFTVTFPGQVARHPTERAEQAPTDAILGEPPQVQLVAELVDKPLRPETYPYDPEAGLHYYGRALDRAAQLARLRDLKLLFTVVVPGFVLSNRAIASLVITPSPEDDSVSIQVALERAVLVDLQAIPVVEDSDSVALGAQKAETGFRGVDIHKLTSTTLQ